MNTGILGFDGQWGRLLAGLALSHSQGEGSFRNGGDASGVVRSELTGLYPYAHFQAGPATSFWGTLGYGTGRWRLLPDEGDSVHETDLGNAMLALGGRGVLSRRMGEAGRFELALRSDALLTNTGADAIEGLGDDSEGSTSRVRLMLEGSGSVAFRGGTLSPTLEAGLRHDGGDAERGMGIELGAGLAWSSGRLTLQLNGRGLLAHEEDEYGEWGYGAAVRYRGADDGSGPRLGLSSAGGRERGGAEALWSLRDAGALARGRTAGPGRRIQLELGYGLHSAWRDALWYPYFGMEASTDSGRKLRMGLKLTSARIAWRRRWRLVAARARFSRRNKPSSCADPCAGTVALVDKPPARRRSGTSDSFLRSGSTTGPASGGRRGWDSRIGGTAVDGRSDG